MLLKVEIKDIEESDMAFIETLLHLSYSHSPFMVLEAGEYRLPLRFDKEIRMLESFAKGVFTEFELIATKKCS